MIPTLTLSRARLAIGRPQASRERRSSAPYLIHQAVADLFGHRDDRGYLYRITGEHPDGPEVLILSNDPPRPLYELTSPAHRRAERIQSKPFAPELWPGQELDFEIRLNATRVVTDPASGRKRRTDAWEAVWQADKQTTRTPHDVYGEYLQRKLTGAAEVQTASMVERGEITARRGDRPNSIRFVAVNLIGSLQIIDPMNFLEIVAAGIGRSKSFGCGLLCLSAPGTVLARRYPERVRGMF